MTTPTDYPTARPDDAYPDLDIGDPGLDDSDGEGIACCDLDGRSDDHHHDLVDWGFEDEGRENPDDLDAAADGPPWATDAAPDFDDRAEWLAPKGRVPGPIPVDVVREAVEEEWDAFVSATRSAGRGGYVMSFEDEATERFAAIYDHVANHGGPVQR